MDVLGLCGRAHLRLPPSNVSLSLAEPLPHFVSSALRV